MPRISIPWAAHSITARMVPTYPTSVIPFRFRQPSSWPLRRQRHDPLHDIIGAFPHGHDRPIGLHLPPAQRTVGPMGDQPHLVRRALDLDLDKALEVGGPAVHERPRH